MTLDQLKVGTSAVITAVETEPCAAACWIWG